MKLILSACCAVALCTATAHAQSTETHTRSKVDVKDGRKVTVTGCVERSPDGLVLTNVAGEASHSYVLVGDKDLAKHVGHRIEVTGKAADQGHGKVEVESKRKVEGGPDEKTHEKAEGNLGGLAVLGVDHVKMVAKSCS